MVKIFDFHSKNIGSIPIKGKKKLTWRNGWVVKSVYFENILGD